MNLTRRRFIGVAATTFWASGAVPVLAGRYLDQTGLKNQSFIWQPNFAPSGPVTIIVSLAEQILHVFRGERLLGIARCKPARALQKLPAGAFRIDAVSSGKRAPLAWRGTSVHTFNVDQTDPDLLSGTLSCIEIAPVFAKLVNSAVTPGALVIMAPERTSKTRVRSFAPKMFHTGATSDSPVSAFDSAAFIFTRGTFGQSQGEDLAPILQPLSIVVSSKDQRARIISSGQPIQVVEIRIAEPGKPLGAHAYSLTTPRMGRSPATWIATGLSDKAGAPHIRNDMAAKSLDRVSFVDPEVVADIENALSPGACIILSDAPLDDRDNANFIRPVLMSASSLSPGLAQKRDENPATPEQKTRPADTSPDATASRRLAKNSNKLGADSKVRRRKVRKALKKRRVIKNQRSSNEPLIGPKNFQDP